MSVWRPTATRSLACAAALAIGCLGGCKTPPVIEAPIPDVAPLRKERREDVLREFDQKRTEAQFSSAAACRAQGDLPSCLEQLESLLKRQPDHVPARVLMAEALLDLDQVDEAQTHLDVLLQQHPDDPRTQQLAADIATALAEPPATDGVDRAGYEEPSQPEAPIDRAAAAALAEGQHRLECDDPAGARDEFQRAVDAAPDDARVVISVATSALRHGDTALARDFLEAAGDAFSDDARFYQTLGLVYYRRGELAAAEVALRQALSLDNGAALAYFLMGSTLAKLGDSAGAATHFEQAAQLDRAYSAAASGLLP